VSTFPTRNGRTRSFGVGARKARPTLPRTTTCDESRNEAATRGEATLFHHFHEYGAHRGEVGGRINGSLVAMSTDKAVAYALDALQQRGKLFVGPGEMCYEGMIVGEHAKSGDLDVNVAKAKQLTNMRAASADKGIQLAPPVTFTLEEALEYIEDDELVEITPKSVRLRKRALGKIERKKANRG
jgi:GTP-binding protein